MGLLIANRCGVILMDAGLSAEDLGFKSLCQYQLTKYVVSQNMRAVTGPFRGGLKGNFPGQDGCIAVCCSFIGHVFSKGGALSSLRRKHT